MEIAPVPEKPFVTGAVTSNSLSVAWEVQGNVSQITYYTLCYRTVEEDIKGATAWEMVNTKKANQEYHLQNLKPNTSYQFRVASNTNGKQSFMSDISDITKTGKDLKTGFRAPTVQLVNVNGQPTHNSVPLSWIVDGDTPSVTHYTIFYKAVGEDADFSNVGQSWITYQTQDAKRRCIVENLEPRTSYRFCVSSNTDKGKGPPSPISNAISTEEDPGCVPIPEKPTRAGTVTFDSVPLSWNVTGNKMTITHYTLICQRTDDKEPPVTYYTKDAQTKFTVNELKPATSYKFSVVSNTQHGRSQPSDTITISTSSIDTESKKAQKPPIPQKLKLKSPVQQDSVSLTWQINSKRNCITHFTVSFRTVFYKKSKSPWSSVETKDYVTCWTVYELCPKTRYQFQVSSNTLFEQSNPSNAVTIETTKSITTTESPIPQKTVELLIPLKPVQAGQVTHDSVPLAWEVSGEPTQVSHYTVSCKRANGTGPLLTYNTESTQINYTVTELNPGTAYEFYVALKTNTGQTNRSQLSESITTLSNPGSLYEQALPLPQHPTLAGMVTHNSVPLTWKVVGNISQIMNYKLLYKKVDSQGLQMIVDTKDAKQSYVVENLDSNTSYFFWVTINIAQLGFQSVPSIISEVITTSPDPNGSTFEQMIPQPNKPTLAASPRHHSLSLIWEVTGKTSLVTHYTLSYRKACSNAPWSTIETGSSNTEFTLYNLESETSYEFRVAANTDKAQSLPSVTSYVITTAEDPQAKTLMQGLPPRPTEPKMMGPITHNCVPITWKVYGDTSHVTHYTITYKVIGETPSKWTAVETEDTEKYFNATDLQPETNYQFRIGSNTELGQSLPSETSDTFRTSKEPLSMSTTPPTTPKKPRAAGAPSHDSVPLSWKVHGNTNDISHYTVSYRKTMSTNAFWISAETYDSETHFTVTDLDPQTAYQFRVSSNTDKGLSLPSDSSDIIYTLQALTSSQHQKPLKPCKLTCIAPKTHDALTLTWKVEGDASLVAYYKVSFRPVDKPTDRGQKAPWLVTETEETWLTVTDLEPKTSYEFGVTITTKDGNVCEGNFEETFMTADLPDYLSLENRALPCPGTPRLAPDQKPTQHTLPIAWEMDADGIQITHFCLFYRQKREECWEEIEIPGIRQHYTIKNLQPGTPYYFRIKAHSSINSSEFSRTAGPFETESRTEGQIFRDDLHAQSKLVSSNKDMPIYQVPLRLAYKHEAERTQRLEFGTPSSLPKQEKIILVVGATGAGKSTLINGLLNHVLGVEWDEKFRFRLVQESGVFEEQHKSQTKVISVYTLNHHPAFKVPFTVTIVDTPGFGDTEGIDKDKLITDSINHLFSREEYGIDHIDAIGFVVQSSLSRLTPTQKYIFESILSLFGKDIGENIFLLITFSDSQKPPVLASTKEASLPFRNYFRFNNSALFAMNDTKDNEFDLMFWKMGTISFQKFLDELMKVEEKSLYLTKEVLEERQHLEVHVSGIQQDITCGLHKLDEFKVELDVVKRHEADIEKNRDFTYTVDEVTMVQVEIPHGKHVTNCMTCNRTCHYPCAFANDEDKKKCSAMDRKTGNCKVCPNKCIWNLHRNVPYKIESITKSVKKTSDDLKKRYTTAKGKKISAEKLTEEILQDFYNLEINVLHLADEIRKCLERLSEIALRPNPLSTVEFLEILMKSERAEARPGFQARLDQLESVKAQAKILFAMSSDDGYDPFAEYRETLGQSNSAQGRIKAAENFKRNNPSLVQRGLNKVKAFLNID